MEATLLHSSADHGSMTSPCKRVRNPRRGPQTRSFTSSRTYNSTTPNLYHSESLPKIGCVTNPPLLPLPTSGSGGGGGSSRGNSLSPAHKKHNKPSKKSPDMKSDPIKNKKVLFGEDIFGNFIPTEEEKFSGSAFPSAPPPSSLPMPKFSLKPKMSCKVEATTGGGLIDTGATDNLCRLLNLR